MTDSKSCDKKHPIKPIRDVANEAVDQLEVALEYLAWFGSLGWAVSSSIKKGHENHAARLAGVAQYLADDYHATLAHDVESLNERLIALEVRA